MEDIIIRKMQLGDHIGIKKNVFVSMPINIIEENVKNNVKAMNEGSTNWVYFVAEYNNEVVGTMYLECKESSISKHIGELFSVVTAEKFQGKGICKKLFQKVSHYALEKGIEKIILTVRGGTVAETVYQKIGFIKYGELPNGIKENNKYFNKIYYYYNLNNI